VAPPRTKYCYDETVLRMWRVAVLAGCLDLQAAHPPRLKQHRIAPQYSEPALQEHISGTVKLEVIVGTDGHVRDVRVTQSVGYGLDEEAMKALRTWEFEPAMEDGKPVEAAVPVQCDFHTSPK
jgi:TonB family protein